MKSLTLLLSFTCFLGLILQVSQAQEEKEDPPTAPVAVISSFEELEALITRDGVKHETDLESQYIACPTQKGPIDSVIVVRWAMEDGVAHFIQIIPLEIPANRMAAVESAMIRMNHAYPVPGLGYNHGAATMYFRFTVPLLPQGFLTEGEVREYFSYTVNQAALLYYTMEAVASGNVEPEDALTFHNARLSAPAPPTGSYVKELNGSTWTLEFSPDNTVRLFRDKAVAVLSSVTIEGDKITFQDTGGPLKTAGNGTYTFATTAEGATFAVVEEPSEGRQKILSGEAWTKQ